MEKIYIIQMHTNSMPSRLVRLATRYPYSHVGISLTGDCGEIYSFGRKSLRNFLNGGFVKERRDGLFFRKFQKTQCRVYELALDENSYESIIRQLSFMESHSQRYKYDFTGAFLRTLHLRITFTDKYVCSTFVAEVLENAGACHFKKELCFIKPEDFENIAGAREIYTGMYTHLASASLTGV